MRTWRVGSISMAVALIAGGISILSASYSTLQITDILMMWWPAIFILLGIEILLYIQFSKQEKFKVRYDMLSIIFIGLLGMSCLLLITLTSTGIMGEIKYVVHSEEATEDLPVIEQELNEDIQKIVVQASDYLPGRIDLHASDEREIHIFGTYRSTQSKLDVDDGQPALTASSIAQLYTVGNTMYITLKPLPSGKGPFRDYPRMNVNIVLPKDIEMSVSPGPNSYHIPDEQEAPMWH